MTLLPLHIAPPTAKWPWLLLLLLLLLLGLLLLLRRSRRRLVIAAASARVLGPEAHREGARSRLSLCERARERR